MNFKQYSKLLTKGLFAILFYVLLSFSVLANEQVLQLEIRQLEKNFQQLSTQIYHHNANELKRDDLTVIDLHQLLTEIEKATNPRQSIQTIQLLYALLQRVNVYQFE